VRYLALNQDGSVAVIVVCPATITRLADGLVVHFLGQYRTDPQPGQPGGCYLWGWTEREGRVYPAQIRVGTEQFDLGDLAPDSVAGHWIEFYDIATMVIDKWVPARRLRVRRVRPCRKDEIPTDRSYRAAWTDDGSRIVHDMAKAKAIFVARLRALRNEALATLDGPWMRSLGQGQVADAQQAEADRQRLRNLPQQLARAISRADTIEALDALWPADLPQPWRRAAEAPSPSPFRELELAQAGLRELLDRLARDQPVDLPLMGTHEAA
jgi:hypothetical protein